MIRSRDLAPEDFPFTIVVHREAWAWEDRENWLWAVTVLPPTPGTRTPLYVPAAGEPAWVSTLTGQGVEVTTGPWEVGNAGRVGRTVTTWVEGPLGRTPVVDWEDQP